MLRWCCSVHKSTPQTLKMREITGKDDYIGMDFVGVRAHESVNRSKYDYENFGKKQKGQYSYNPILEWTSAEIWLYIFMNDMLINEAYKKGNSRAGCLFCPMGGGISDYFRKCSYRQEIDEYVNYIRQSYGSTDSKKTQSYIQNGGWNARKNGRDLAHNPFRCVESVLGENISITVANPTTDWREWIKTIGDLHDIESGYAISYKDKEYPFTITDTENGYVVLLSQSISKESPKFVRLFRQVFRKASYCGKCRVCETNCRNGSIKFKEGKVRIENCIHCHQCHEGQHERRGNCRQYARQYAEGRGDRRGADGKGRTSGIRLYQAAREGPRLDRRQRQGGCRGDHLWRTGNGKGSFEEA